MRSYVKLFVPMLVARTRNSVPSGNRMMRLPDVALPVCQMIIPAIENAATIQKAFVISDQTWRLEECPESGTPAVFGSSVPDTIQTIIEQAGGLGLKVAFTYIGASQVRSWPKPLAESRFSFNAGITASVTASTVSSSV